MTLDDCDTLFARVQATRSPAELTPLFEQLLAECPVIRVGVTRGSIYWRARPCSPQGYPNIRDVTYPPAHAASLNRLSDQKQPRFYASSRKETAMAEQAECKAGDYFHVLGSWVKYGHGVRALVLGEQHHVYKTGYWRTFGVDPGNTLSRQMNARPRSESLRAIYIDAFLGETLADPLARNSGYVRSRALLSTIASKYPVDAVFYPSVKDEWGTNIVITPEAVDSQMVYCVSQVVRVDRCRKFGVIETSLVQQASGIGPDGEFQWLPKSDPNQEIIFGMTKEEHEFGLRNANSRNGLLDLIAFQKS
jgi:RES domain